MNKKYKVVSKILCSNNMAKDNVIVCKILFDQAFLDFFFMTKDNVQKL